MIGLSPLARGTLQTACGKKLLHRFIPAGAGNTDTGKITGVALPVYPRWRGEHNPYGYMKEDFYGLSPLARGTRKYGWVKTKLRRFIPAGAGNTDLKK
ncbi:hypothetical protein CFSAN001076_07399 [Salmonella enterica subsp. enterica serovar Litchfield str. CFSAN001076]|nr:hypothetical protein CFSAN001076_07399 [Salmonella enterica subsp. enterica serovar Litchfield str. CFSAN001076]